MRIRLSSRHRWLLAGAFGLALLLLLGMLFLAPILERKIEERLIATAARHGLLLQIDDVRVRFLRGLQISGILLEHSAGVRIHAERLDFGLAPWGSGWIGPLIRVRTGRAVVLLPGRGRLQLAPRTWNVRVGRGAVRARLRRGRERLEITWLRSASSQLHFQAARLRASDWIDVLIRDTIEIRLGIVDGIVQLKQEGRGALRFIAEVRSQDFVLNGLKQGSSLAANGDASGIPTDVDLRLAAVWHPAKGEVILDQARLSAAGATLLGQARIWGGMRDPHVDLDLDVERVDFTLLLATVGLTPPVGAHDLGSATLGAHVVGRIADPRSFRVEQRLDFTPPRHLIPDLARLRHPFTHRVVTASGRRQRIDVSPESADFIALEEVPPLFLRALLLAEDMDFYGHRGVDLGEVPAAIAINWKRGAAARGASTITQQLAKNLFLTREKNISRKLQELALALLLESTLSKQRIIEIYLNIIEWGPDLYGLRPAARHYFGRQPADLTPKEMAFLVSLIPGPIKYQTSFRDGTPSPAFESLTLALLAKLRSVEALTEDEYQQALFETIIVRRDGSERVP